MDEWVQRPNFKADLRDHREATGKTNETIAAELRVSIYTLQNWAGGSKVPSFRCKKQIAELFAVDVRRYEDIPQEDASPIGEVGRFQIDQARLVLEDPRFTDADRQELVDELKAKAKWMISIKASKVL